MKHLLFATLVTSCICLVAACGKGDKAQDKAPSPSTAPVPASAEPATAPAPKEAAAPPSLAVGMKVKMISGDHTFDLEILALYGKLALVHFRPDQVVKGSVLDVWVDAAELEPKSTPLALPPGDSCVFSAGQQVSCPFLTDRRRYKGRVAETHGKMALVRYDSDGATVWNFCTECKIR